MPIFFSSGALLDQTTRSCLGLLSFLRYLCTPHVAPFIGVVIVVCGWMLVGASFILFFALLSARIALVWVLFGVNGGNRDTA